MESNVSVILILASLIVGFIIGKWFSNDFPDDIEYYSKRLKFLKECAGSFVAWADEFMKASTGKEKMEMVYEKIIDLCKSIEDESSITNFFDESEIKAVIQESYNSFKLSKSLTETTDTKKKTIVKNVVESEDTETKK